MQGLAVTIAMTTLLSAHADRGQTQGQGHEAPQVSIKLNEVNYFEEFQQHIIYHITNFTLTLTLTVTLICLSLMQAQPVSLVQTQPVSLMQAQPVSLMQAQPLSLVRSWVLHLALTARWMFFASGHKCDFGALQLSSGRVGYGSSNSWCSSWFR